jgi:hypothetical protein
LTDKKTNKEYTWRAYIDRDLERPVKIAAIKQDVDVCELISEIISKNLPEVKIIQ